LVGELHDLAGQRSGEPPVAGARTELCRRGRGSRPFRFRDKENAMRVLGKFALSLIATVLSAAGVVAADAVTVPTSSQTPIAVPVHDNNSFDWFGFYAGVFGGVQNGSVSETQYGI